MAFTISGTNGLTFPDATTMDTGQQACKAWVNFDGNGTIQAAVNVSSVTKNAAANFTINFTTAFQDTNYAFVSGTGWSSTGNVMGTMSENGGAGARTVSTFRVLTGIALSSTNWGAVNPALTVSAAFYR